LKISFAQTNPNILSTHHFQYKKKKMNKNHISLRKKKHTKNVIFFVKALQTLTFYLQWNSNMQDNRKVEVISNHRKGKQREEHEWLATTQWTIVVVPKKINKHNEH
jgi:hypothetical protein